MRTDSRLVQMFVAVADTLSFTRGAETLHVAQPWLSSQIRKLEAQLGFDLFIRDSRRVALSEQGKALRGPAHAVMQSLEEFSACASMLRIREDRPLLRIGLPPYSHLFAKRVALLERFAQLQPKIQIEIVLGWSPELVERVATGTLDMAFTVGEVIDPLLDYHLISLAPCHLCCRSDDPLAALKVVHSADLHGRTILSFERGLNPAMHEQLFGAAQRAGAVLQVDHEMMSDLWLQRILGGDVVGLNFIRKPPSQLRERLCMRPFADADDIALRLVRRRSPQQPAVELCWQIALGAGATNNPITAR
ncbi:LysR family transcriptional regulator [Stenotrophomonas sp. Iso1]|uniref:LysR family transcriptional regulator n=1 Tax=Stenotrophomonas sp. Iso1 TaxID=2977283 RepID=UPI0022B7CE11|nr:LysR family transcriptional regulator [Stenotrophomonas sp. Iso1]